MWRYMDLAFVTRDVITFTALLRIYSESPSTVLLLILSIICSHNVLGERGESA